MDHRRSAASRGAGIAPGGAGAVDAVPIGWCVSYVVVEDLDAAAKQAIEPGGRVLRDETTGPAGTSVSVADPGSGSVALVTPAAA
jgi:predicted enzyme related to lactoylglutathione lyase